MPSHIVDQYNAFVSKTFLIRFCEEEVRINDICFFRAELDAYPPNKFYSQLFMEV